MHFISGSGIETIPNVGLHAENPIEFYQSDFFLKTTVIILNIHYIY
jgi:hypothetical protein